MAHVDLHLHLLPGVDDGAPDEAAALEHAARIAADGVREATVTPHIGAPVYPLDPLTVPERTAALQDALDREGIALRLHPGGEIFPRTDLSARALDAIAHGPPGAPGCWRRCPSTASTTASSTGCARFVAVASVS
jgi:protein-tyrosine phosphatase